MDRDLFEFLRKQRQLKESKNKRNNSNSIDQKDGFLLEFKTDR